MSAPTKTPETLTAAARAAQLSIAAQGPGGTGAPGRLTAADARARLALAVDRPGNAAGDLKVGDELDGSTMVLPVDAVHPYEKNPRIRENPKYLSIKESVRAQGGVTNQITVTKRPGDDFYIPFGGGNTRVLVMQELWHETQDPKFKHLTVVYRAWRGHAANIAAHLAENHNRGDTSFWETARGLSMLKQELEQELGRVLSASELNREAKRLGMDFGNSSVQAFLFAVEYLAPVGPWLLARAVNQTLKPCLGALQALCVQLGHGQAETRAALDRVLELAGEMLLSQEEGKSPDAEVRLDVEELVHALNGAIAEMLGVPAAALPVMLAARAANPRITAEQLRHSALPPQPPRTPAAAGAPSPSAVPHHAAPAPPASQGAAPAKPPVQLPLQPAMLATVQQAVPERDSALQVDSATAMEPADPANAPATVREILADITRVADLADVVAVCESMPLGYYVELPDAGNTVADGQAIGDDNLRKAGWQVLAALSGQFDRRLAPRLPLDSRFRQLALAGGGDLMPRLQSTLSIAGTADPLGIAGMHAFFWHPQLGDLFLQLWSWALHWRKSEPARFIDRLQPLTD